MHRMLYFLFLALSSCVHSQLQPLSGVSGLVSVSGDKCEVDGSPRQSIKCGIESTEEKDAVHIITLGFAPGFVSMPACVFQSFSIKKYNYSQDKLEANINLISSSEVRVRVRNLNPKLLSGDIVLSFICK